jgi:hypothetical protein
MLLSWIYNEIGEFDAVMVVVVKLPRSVDSSWLSYSRKPISKHPAADKAGHHYLHSSQRYVVRSKHRTSYMPAHDPKTLHRPHLTQNFLNEGNSLTY